jgi:protoheme IX farnesyltransferase
MRLYYQLVKPGIVYGNLMTALAAFLFASHMQVNVVLLLATLLGLALSIASACVVNNVLDRDIDAHMERTKNRALVLGQISVRSALIYASLLALVGFSILALFSTWPAFFVTAGGVFVYLCLYTPAKRSTQYSTLVGSHKRTVLRGAFCRCVETQIDKDTACRNKKGRPR